MRINIMYRVTIERIAGGYATPQTVAVIDISNNAEGIGGVKIYDGRLVLNKTGGEETPKAQKVKVHREPSDDVLRLVQRTLSRLLGDLPE